MSEWTPIWTTLRVGLAAGLVAFPLGLGAALLAFLGPRRWQRWMEALILLPLLLAGPVIGFVLLIVLGGTGLLAGLIELSKDSPVVLSEGLAALGAVCWAAPFVALLALWELRRLSVETLRLGQVLGLSPWAIIGRILLPGLRSRLGVIAVFGLARATAEFGIFVLFGFVGQTVPLSYALIFKQPGAPMWLWISASASITLLLLGAALWLRRGERLV